MGYTTTWDGCLCCDNCGKSVHDGVKVRRRRCPHGYCPGSIICNVCWDGGIRAEDRRYHTESHCKEKHEEYVAEENLKRALIARGVGVRCAALNQNDGTVKVWFRYPEGDRAFYMTPETYRAISIGRVATLDDYKAIGAVVA